MTRSVLAADLDFERIVLVAFTGEDPTMQPFRSRVAFGALRNIFTIRFDGADLDR